MPILIAIALQKKFTYYLLIITVNSFYLSEG